MSGAKKSGLIGGSAGFCLGLLMSAFAYYANSHHLAYDLSVLYLCLAPTSIVLMAGERATPSAVAMIVLVFAFSNAVIYGVAFLVIAKLWNLISRQKRNEP